MLPSLSLESRRRAYEEDPRWPTKAIMRMAATVSAAIAVGLFAASISYTNANFVNTNGIGDWTDGLPLAPAVLALIYNPATLVHHLIARRGRPAHPAFHVAMDLIVWALLVPAIILSVAGGIFWYWTAGLPNTQGAVDCGFDFNAFSMECSPVVYDIGRLEIAGIVFLFFLFAIHLVLFVFACLDLHRLRMATKLGRGMHDFDLQLRKDSEQGSLTS